MGVGVKTDGQFSLEVAPGTYTIVGHSSLVNGGSTECLPKDGNPVAVGGKTTEVEVVCHLR